MIDGLSRAVTVVGEELLALRASGSVKGRWEPGYQFKADADRTAHATLERQLKAMSPAIPVISEEDPSSFTDQRPDTYWLIDPIDGTASFAHGFDGFVTQAALMREHRPVLAAVYAPASDELFLAQENGGATCNGRPLRVVSRPLNEGTLTDNYPEPRAIAAELMRVFDIPNYLESGSIGLKICRVAQGRADLLVKDVVVRDWDVAPAELVLSEAGGILVDSLGRRFSYQGPFTRCGLVAAASVEAINLSVAWLEHRENAASDSSKIGGV